jgi:DNA-binding response OmpR family regulator
MAETEIVTTSMHTLQRRVVFSDFSTIKFNIVMEWLKNDGIDSEGVTEKEKLVSLISEHAFDVVIVNLLIGGTGPFELISNLRTSSKNKDLKIIVISRQVQKVNIQNTMRAGANDFMADPFENESLHNRVLYHLVPKRVIEPDGYEHTDAGRDSWDYVKLMLEATELLSRTERDQTHSAFFTILQGIAKLLDSNRTSLIVVDEKNNAGTVLASSDDVKFVNFPVQLSKYPEIMHVMHTGNLVVIEDVSKNAMTADIAAKVKSIAIGAIMVFPVRFQNDIMGVMTVRRKDASGVPSMDVMRVVQAICNIMASHYNIEAVLRRIYRDFKKAA